jgi:hypothetical protein
MASSPQFFELAFKSHIVMPALKIALIVGTLLAIINHSSAILQMDMDVTRFLQIVLTYCVPYCVSTYSAVKAIQGRDTVLK